MWTYEKRLQYPVKISKTCPKTAQLIISQFGGPDGELAASMRYLSQRYTMPCKEVAGLLTDIGTEELAHLEMQRQPDLMLITSTTLPDYGRRLQAEFHLMPVNSNPKAMQSLTCSKTWLLSRRQGPLMTTS